MLTSRKVKPKKINQYFDDSAAEATTNDSKLISQLVGSKQAITRNDMRSSGVKNTANSISSGQTDDLDDEELMDENNQDDDEMMEEGQVMTLDTKQDDEDDDDEYEEEQTDPTQATSASRRKQFKPIRIGNQENNGSSTTGKENSELKESNNNSNTLSQKINDTSLLNKENNVSSNNNNSKTIKPNRPNTSENRSSSVEVHINNSATAASDSQLNEKDPSALSIKKTTKEGFECGFCASSSFLNLEELKNHLYKDHIELIISTLVATSQQQTTAKAGKSTSSINMDSFCNICKKEVCNKYFLKSHLLNKHGIQLEDYLAMQQQTSGQSGPAAASNQAAAALVAAAVANDLIENHPQGLNMQSLNSAVTSKLMNASSPAVSNPYYNNKYQSRPSLGVNSGVKSYQQQHMSYADEPDMDHDVYGRGYHHSYDQNDENMMNNEYNRDSLSTANQKAALLDLLNNDQFKLLTGGTSSSSSNPASEDFCDICQKQFCNKYYLKKHRQDVHGVTAATSTTPGSTTTTEAPKNIKKIMNDLGALAALTGTSSGVSSGVASPQPNSNKNGSNVSNNKDLTSQLTNMLINNPLLLNPILSQLNKPSTPTPPQVSSSSSPLSLPMTKPSQSPPSTMSSHASASSSAIASSSSSSSVRSIVKPESIIPSIGQEAQNVESSPAVPPGQVKCDLCPKVFFSQEYLTLHKANKHNRPQPMSSISNNHHNTQPAVGNQSTGTGSNNVLYSESFCEYCNKSFCNKYFLRTHMNKAHGKTLIIESSNHTANNNNTSYDDYEGAYGTENGTSNGHHGGEMTNENTYFASKVVDRVVCDICNKQVCNKYFLRTHKQKVHGIFEPSTRNSANHSASLTSLYTNGGNNSSILNNNNNTTTSNGQYDYDDEGENYGGQYNGNKTTTEDGELEEPYSSLAGYDEGPANSVSGEVTKAATVSSSCSELGEMGTSGRRQHRLSSTNSNVSSTGSMSTTSSSNDRNQQKQDSFCHLCKRKFYSYNFLCNHMKKIHGVRFPSVSEDDATSEKRASDSPSVTGSTGFNGASDNNNSAVKPTANNASNLELLSSVLLKLNKNLGPDQIEQLVGLLSGSAQNEKSNQKSETISQKSTSEAPSVQTNPENDEDSNHSRISIKQQQNGVPPNKVKIIEPLFYKCALCTKKFPSRSVFKKHLILRHRLSFSLYVNKYDPKLASSDSQKQEATEKTNGDHSSPLSVLSMSSKSNQNSRKRKNSASSSVSVVSSTTCSSSALPTHHDSATSELSPASSNKKLKFDENCLEDSTMSKLLELMKQFYALQSDGHNKTDMLQPFVLEAEIDTESKCDLVPCVVYLPVKTRIDSSASMRIKLRPVEDKKEPTTNSEYLKETHSEKSYVELDDDEEEDYEEEYDQHEPHKAAMMNGTSGLRLENIKT